jgi:hypothetical protein
LKNSNDFKETNPKSKWCKLHRTATHSDQECFKQQRKKPDESKKTMLIKEQTSQQDLIKLHAYINDTPCIVVIDIGSQHSFINKKVSERFKKDEIIKTTPLTIEMANGEHVIIKEKMNIGLRIGEKSNKTINVDLRVFENLKADVLLGEDSLLEYNCKIDYDTEMVTIAGIKHMFGSTKTGEKDFNPDKEIISKSNLNFMKKQESLKETIRQAMISNPLVGRIDAVTHRIHLKTNTPIAQKPYPVPFKLWNPIKDEIKRLIEFKIIRESDSEYAAPAFPILKRDNQLD